MYGYSTVDSFQHSIELAKHLNSVAGNEYYPSLRLGSRSSTVLVGLTRQVGMFHMAKDPVSQQDMLIFGFSVQAERLVVSGRNLKSVRRLPRVCLV